jgi:lipopolysaccharide export system protein LptA
MPDNFLRILLAASTLIASSTIASLSYSLPDDVNQPIRVVADTAIRDESRGQTIYSGDVTITQGSLTISAESIVILERDSDVTSIVASGEPATLSQQLSVHGERVNAVANSIDYNVQTAVVQLLDNAELNQGGSKISSQQITYSVREQIINAQSSGSSSRVEMVIPAKVITEQPKQEKP